MEHELRSKMQDGFVVLPPAYVLVPSQWPLALIVTSFSYLLYFFINFLYDFILIVYMCIFFNGTDYRDDNISLTNYIFKNIFT